MSKAFKKVDYDALSFVVVKGNTVNQVPYMGQPRPNALIEDLTYRRRKAQYVCVLHDGEALPVTEACEDHVEICLAALDKSNQTPGITPEEPKKKGAKKATKKTAE